jgi:hypothetical protein
MAKKNNFWNITIISTIIFVMIIIGAAIVLKTLNTKETIMYFNSETDLPDNLLTLKTNSTTNPIQTNEEYDIIFTIQAGTTGKYKVVVDSPLHSSEKELDLVAGELKKLTIKIKPTLTDKWELNSTKRYEWNDQIDITDNSWLAEKRDFAILMNNNTLPTIQMEDYHLPISNEISSLGDVYHINLDLNELKIKPFTKIYENNYELELTKKTEVKKVELKVQNNILLLNAKTTTNTYESEERGFLIKLYKENNIDVDDSGFRKTISELKFMYQII